MLENNSEPIGRFSQNIDNPVREKGESVGATGLAPIEHDDGTAFFEMALVDPEPLRKGWRVFRPVVKELRESLHWELFKLRC